MKLSTLTSAVGFLGTIRDIIIKLRLVIFGLILLFVSYQFIQVSSSDTAIGCWFGLLSIVSLLGGLLMVVLFFINLIGSDVRHISSRY